jgi:hypothetical protein
LPLCALTAAVRCLFVVPASHIAQHALLLGIDPLLRVLYNMLGADINHRLTGALQVDLRPRVGVAAANQ